MPLSFIPAPHRDAVLPHTGLDAGTRKTPVISLAGIEILAAGLAVSRTQAMVLCLESGLWPLRFVRNTGVFSAKDQIRLLQSRAAIIGCGALGGFCSMLLARLGIGALTLCDPDVFDESNLNRQLFATEATIGAYKAETARSALLGTAGHMDIRTALLHADAGTTTGVLQDADIAVDCLDSLAARKPVEKGALALGIPFIHGSLAGTEGFAAVSLPGDAGVLERVYAGYNGAPGAEKDAGLPAPTPAFIASLEAWLAVRVLLTPPGERPPLADTMIYADLSQPEISLLALARA